MSASDISGLMNISSSSNQTSVLSMEEKKKKSHGGAAGSASVSTGLAPAPSTMMTEQNVQLLPTNRLPAVGTSQVSIVSSAERARRYHEARAVFEMAEARVAMIAAQNAMSGSQTGSAGRRLDDVRSDTGSSGPSPPTRQQAQESPFAGVYSPPPTPTTTIAPTPAIYEVFSEQRGVNILDQILIPTRGISESSGFHPPSGSGPSESPGALLGGGSRLLSVASESSGPANPHGMASVSTGSPRPLKHDRHGNPVPERAVPAATAHSHPGSVASVSTGHGPGGRNSVPTHSGTSDSVSIAPWFKGGALAES